MSYPHPAYNPPSAPYNAYNPYNYNPYSYTPPNTYGPPLTPYNPPPPPTVPEPIGPKVLESLKRLGRISAWVIPAVVVAGTAIANEPGMAQAATNWKNGIAGRLDDGVKQLLPQLVATSRSGWIALDQQEFERVVWIFHREIGALRGVLGDVGGMVDEVAAGYRSYWVKLATLGVTTLTLLMFAKRLQAFPHTKLYGGLLEKFVASGTNGAVAILTLTLVSGLRGAGDIMSSVIKKEHQFGYIKPSGAAAVNFEQATINAKGFPSFQAPDKPGDLPKGYEKFDWVEPNQEST
ncbi:hypothetical protein [Nonomuraea sp. NEAU-A123]|uniref:hypothetical protein n=1 Tax=Nonomuraea sp. NEAU-A123 TaxID=2839649 RepID=UPI001BE477E6|nr:hypothetical protein [Nonomuraea sp. NEAU-A123]MBT2224509.1 hypothetical protein [Nonomuraea sp. NEAU-A123]